MAKRRTNSVELCFDSMSDLITNLAGGLLLLVLLLFGATRPATSQTVPTPGRADQAASPGMEQVQPLLDRISQLQSGVRQVEQDVKDLERRMPVLRQELEELLKKVEQVPERRLAQKPRATPKPTRVAFIPPLERIVEKEDVVMVVEEGRVSFVDESRINERVRQSREQGGNGTNSFAFELSESDFRVEGNGEGYKIVRKPGASGEAVPEILRPASRFQQALAKHDRGKYVVRFFVYPDSYAAYREARRVAMSAGFNTAWEPREPDDPAVRWGGGEAMLPTINN